MQKDKGKGEKSMKTMRRTYVVMLGLALIMSCSSCGGEKEQAENEPAIEATAEAGEATTEADTEPTGEAEETEAPAIEENGESETQQSQNDTETDGITIYYGDNNAENIVKETINEQEITPELLVEELAKHDILTEDTSVNSLREVTTNGKKKLEVDFSEEFQEVLYNQGSSGEFIMIGSVVDTFLKAYDAETMTITVNGNTLESGHYIYDAEMEYYDIDENADADQVASGIASALGVE